jgi:hypothetical protein
MTTEHNHSHVHPRRRSFGRRLLRFVLTLAVMVVALGASGFLAYSAWLRSHEPYTTALKLVRQDPKLAEKLGQPIKEVYWPLPTIQGTGDMATVAFKVKGPKCTASITGDARRDKQGWYLQSLSAYVSDGSPKLVVDTGTEESEENVAPKWPANPAPPAPDKSPAGASAGPTTPAPGPTVPGTDINVELPPVDLPADAAKTGVPPR